MHLLSTSSVARLAPLAFLFESYWLTQASASGADVKPVIPASKATAKRPHIVVVMVDDLGWSSAGFNLAPEQRRGPDQVVQTPEIDKLASTGVVLKRHYAGKMCAPSRSSFMTGRFPIHVNQLNPKIFEPGTGLPLGMSTIAEMLSASGYATHHVGKWHLGMSSMEMLPVRRGFSTSLALLSGSADHFTLRVDNLADLWLNEGPAKDLKPPAQDNVSSDCVPYSDANSNKTGMCKTFSQDIYLKHAEETIRQHDASVPMFMFLALQMPHGPLQAPNRFLDFYTNKMWAPRRYAYAMISSVDEAVRDLQVELQKKGMWKDTLFLFTSDNGGSREHEANYPLRGAKATDFEGGVRVASFIAGGYLPNEMRGRTLSGLMHICDWWATFAALAGVDVTPDMEDPRSKDGTRHGHSIPPHAKNVDSLNMWPYISGAASSSPRQVVVLSGAKDNKDRLSGALIDGRWKLIVGKQLDAAIPRPTTPDETDAIAWAAPFPPNQPYQSPIDCGKGCLFDLETDERELHDLRYSMEHREILLRMQDEMSNFTETSFQAHTVGGEDKTNAKNVARDKWDRFWGPWQEDLPENAWTGVKVRGKKLKLDDDEGNPIKNLTAASLCQSKCRSYGNKCKAWSFLGGPGNDDGETLCTLFKVLFTPALMTRFSWISEVMDHALLADSSLPPAAQGDPAEHQEVEEAASSVLTGPAGVSTVTTNQGAADEVVAPLSSRGRRWSEEEEEEQGDTKVGDDPKVIPQFSVVFIIVVSSVGCSLLVAVVMLFKCRRVKSETSTARASDAAARRKRAADAQKSHDCADTELGLGDVVVHVPSRMMLDDAAPVGLSEKVMGSCADHRGSSVVSI